MAEKWKQLEWEIFSINGPGITQRAKIQSGWLVEIAGRDNAMGLTFVPDPKHEWKLDWNG